MATQFNVDQKKNRIPIFGFRNYLFQLESSKLYKVSNDLKPLTVICLPERSLKCGQKIFIAPGKLILEAKGLYKINLGLSHGSNVNLRGFDIHALDQEFAPLSLISEDPDVPISEEDPDENSDVPISMEDPEENSAMPVLRKHREIIQDGFKLLKDATIEEQLLLPVGVRRKLVHFGHVVWVKFNTLANPTTKPSFHLVAFDPGVNDLAYATDTYGNSYRYSYCLITLRFGAGVAAYIYHVNGKIDQLNSQFDQKVNALNTVRKSMSL